MLLQIVEAQLDNKNFNTPLPPTTAGLDASPAIFFELPAYGSCRIGWPGLLKRQSFPEYTVQSERSCDM